MLAGVLNLNHEELQSGEVSQLEELYSTFLHACRDIFSLSNDAPLWCSTRWIATDDSSPIKQAPRCLPFIQRKVVSDLIEDMQSKGIIQPSTSVWASPIVLVPKKDGTTCFCVDYRKLISCNQYIRYPVLMTSLIRYREEPLFHYT